MAHTEANAHRQQHLLQRDVLQRRRAEACATQVPHGHPHPGGGDELDQEQPPVREQQLDAAYDEHQHAGDPGRPVQVAPRRPQPLRRGLDLLGIGVRDSAHRLDKPDHAAAHRDASLSRRVSVIAARFRGSPCRSR